MTALNRAAVARDIADREDELDELATARALAERWFEKFCRRYSGLPQHGATERDPGWSEAIETFEQALDEALCERERTLRSDIESDSFLLGEAG